MNATAGSLPAPEDPVTDSAGDRPDSPGAAAVVVLAAFLVGAGAVAASSVLSSAAPRVLIAVVLVVAGWLVARPAGDRRRPLAVALGERVLGGVGTSVAVLGSYLLGLALLTASVPTGDEESAPSPSVVILLVYGVPALALLAVSLTGTRAWTAGAGAVLPMLAVLLLAAAGVDAAAVSITMLVVAAALAVLVLLAPAVSGWGDLVSAAAAMAASFAFGAGGSPFGSLGTTQVAGAAVEAEGTLTGAAQAVVVGGALVVAAVVLVVAVLRRDLAGGVLAGSVFTVPPMLSWAEPLFGAWPTGVQVALAAVPALVALVALAGLRAYPLRRALVSVPAAGRSADPRPSDAVTAAVFAVAFAAAAVVFVVLAVPVFGWDARAQGAIAVVVLAGVGALAYWLPDPPGAAAAVVALLGLALASPWTGLLLGGGVGATTGSRVTAGVVGLVVAVGLAWLLARRHRRVAVHGAAAYLLIGSIAALLGAVLLDPDHLNGHDGPFRTDWAPITIVALPLLLLGVPAAVAAFGRHAATGQAVGAVVLAAGGFVPLKILVGRYAGGGGHAAQVSLNPLTPSDWNMVGTFGLEGVLGPAVAGVAAMAALALVLAASLGRRTSAPLAAAVALVLLGTVQSSLLTVLTAGSVEEAELLGRVLGAVALGAALVAVAAALTATRRARTAPTA